MRQYWHCAATWIVPSVDCDERGVGDAGAEKHTKATGHPTTTTIRDDWKGGA